MKVYRYPKQNKWGEIVERPLQGAAAKEKQVRKILEKVKKKGDKAIIRFTKKFDGVNIDRLEVSEKEKQDAASAISDELRSAILQAKNNIEAFHRKQVSETEMIETMPGVKCWRRSVPIEKVGLYIPGGSAPLFSTVLMLAIPAQIAGCREIILCTPAKGKNAAIDPAVLFAASCCGIERIYKVGGAQAIAAMAYGTASIPKVQKIFGPGNQYVTTAKQLVQQGAVAIDMPAGPSEVLVIADETADPSFVAADLLSQAEHGPDSQVILLTTDEMLLDRVSIALEEQVKRLPRQKIAALSLSNSRMVVLKNLEQAIELSNLYAPEHLILAVKDPISLETKIISAGSVFLGHYSPESAGDYASGTNHSLPTNGYAAMYSGVSVDSFLKKITFQQLSEEGLNTIAATVMVMAEAEGLKAHSNAVAIRLKNRSN